MHANTARMLLVHPNVIDSATRALPEGWRISLEIRSGEDHPTAVLYRGGFIVKSDLLKTADSNQVVGDLVDAALRFIETQEPVASIEDTYADID